MGGNMKKTMAIVPGNGYLNFPVRNDGDLSTVTIAADGAKVDAFKIELTEGEPDYWAYCEIGRCAGKTIDIIVDGYGGTSEVLDLIEQDADIKGAQDLYREKHRPRFHFSSKRGWLNDPNGLVYCNGVYHLFYQHNPYGTKWGNMHWGHAVSHDLLHWEERGEALKPDETGTMYSGSGVVDTNNTSGLKSGEEDLLVFLYTAAGGTSEWSKGRKFTQCLAYSRDGGKTLVKYEGNPVLEHLVKENRDPRVFWHGPTGRWVMALYLSGSTYALFTSDDLIGWEKTDEIRLKNDNECPDMFALCVDGDAENRKWVFWGAKGRYVIGTFDGNTFAAESGCLESNHGNNGYAAQTWSNMPGGRVVQISWATCDIPDMPFNKQMTFPVELSLRNTDDGVRLFSYPIPEIKALYDRHFSVTGKMLRDKESLLIDEGGDAFDVDMEIAAGGRGKCVVDIRGVEIVYDMRRQTVSCLDKRAKLRAEGSIIRLRILVDRASIEIYGNGGRVYMPMGAIPEGETAVIRARGCDVGINTLNLYRLKGIWD